MSGLYEGLLEEIKFWQTLIRDSELDASSLEYQRMQSALQLAQMKLDDLAAEQTMLIYPANTSTRH